MPDKTDWTLAIRPLLKKYRVAFLASPPVIEKVDLLAIK